MRHDQWIIMFSATSSRLVRTLYSIGLSSDNLHILGFGVGAHIAGYAGAYLESDVRRVTALDPDGNLYRFFKSSRSSKFPSLISMTSFRSCVHLRAQVQAREPPQRQIRRHHPHIGAVVRIPGSHHGGRSYRVLLWRSVSWWLQQVPYFNSSSLFCIQAMIRNRCFLFPKKTLDME